MRILVFSSEAQYEGARRQHPEWAGTARRSESMTSRKWHETRGFPISPDRWVPLPPTRTAVTMAV